MRLPMTAATLAAIAWFYGAHAGPSLGQGCIAVGQGYQRVAATVATPDDCCAGRLQCSRFLSTTTVVRPARDQHT